MSLTITTPTTTRVVPAYRVRSDPFELHARAETNAGDRVVTYGDRGRVATPLEVEVSVQEASFADSVALAKAIIQDAEQATSVTTYRGTRAVDGLLTDRTRTENRLVRVTLTFAPVEGGYS